MPYRGSKLFLTPFHRQSGIDFQKALTTLMVHSFLYGRKSKSAASILCLILKTFYKIAFELFSEFW